MHYKNFILTALLATFITTGFAQSKYYTRDGKIKFFSSTSIEDIKAVSSDASSVYDISSGKVQFAVPMKSFTFKKALMQEHFNEDYVESDKYPKAEFKGTFEYDDEPDLSEPGTYEVTAKGTFTLHGVSREIQEKGTITVTKNGKIIAESVFMVKPADYDITIPASVRDQIANSIEVTVKFDYKPLKR